MDIKIKSRYSTRGTSFSNLFRLFFIDDVLVKLNKSVLGSFIHSLCFNAFMYADDIILLSISIEDIQKMLDIYNVEFKSLEMSVNTNKSVCIRV